MAFIPKIRNDDIDNFENQLKEYLATATVGSMRAAVRNAARFIEDEAENAGLDMNHVNNATSTFCRVFNTMDDRLFAVNKELRELKAVIAAAVAATTPSIPTQPDAPKES